MKFKTWSMACGNGEEYIELKDCPFCGGGPKITHIGNDYMKNKTIEIKCTGDCRCKMRNATLGTHNFAWLEEISAKHWNKRI